MSVHGSLADWLQEICLFTHNKNRLEENEFTPLASEWERQFPADIIMVL